MKTEINEKLVDTYKELITTFVGLKTRSKITEFSVFTPGIGKHYNQSIMVVGQATNSWGDCRLTLGSNNNLQSLILELKNVFNTKGLDWIDNPYGSPFLRTMDKLANAFNEKDNISNLHKIVWSNLYKIAPTAEGNPRYKAKDIQLEYCKKILFQEIDIFQPKIVIFLTGIDWAGNFLKYEGVKMHSETFGNLVEATASISNSKLIVAKHPARKAEDKIIEEIIKASNDLA